MMKFIQKLQAKPEHERRRILIASSIGLTLIVFIAWVSTFYFSVTNVQVDGTQVASPYGALKETISNALSGFKF